MTAQCQSSHLRSACSHSCILLYFLGCMRFPKMLENDQVNLNLDSQQTFGDHYNLHRHIEENLWIMSGDVVSVGSQGSDSKNQQYCWICLLKKEENEGAEWVQPCICRGSIKYLHQACLQTWIRKQQYLQNMTKTSCPHCLTEYVVQIPTSNTFVKYLDTVDHLLSSGCQLLAGGFLVTGIYWIAVSHGAFTLMQVLGYRETLAIIAHADSFTLRIGLPAIPIILIIGNWVGWDANAFQFIYRKLAQINGMQRFLPFRVDVEPIFVRAGSEEDDNDDINSPTRIFCGALLMPTIANLFGRLFFRSIHSNFRRTILGGATYLVAKETVKIYYKYMLHTRRRQRVILDYTDANIRAYERHHRLLY